MKLVSRPPKDQCEHEWKDEETHIVADNPKFNYEKDHTVIHSICQKCQKKIVKDIVII